LNNVFKENLTKSRLNILGKFGQAPGTVGKPWMSHVGKPWMSQVS
jgi:hypothetical protein